MVGSKNRRLFGGNISWYGKGGSSYEYFQNLGHLFKKKFSIKRIKMLKSNVVGEYT